MMTNLMNKLKQNKFLVIGVAAVLVIAIVAVVLIALPDDAAQNSGKKHKGSANLEGYSDTLPEYTRTQEYDINTLSDGVKRISYEQIKDSIIQYADASGINSLNTSTSNCVTVCTFDYSQHPEAFDPDFVNTYLTSKNFNFTEGYKKTVDDMEVVLSIGTIKSFTDADASCIIMAHTEKVSIMIVVTGTSDCTYTPDDVAQIREAAFVIYDTLSISDIPQM